MDIYNITAIFSFPNVCMPLQQGLYRGCSSAGDTPGHKPRKHGQPGSHTSLVDFSCHVLAGNIAGCATTLSIPSCFREFYTTNQESLGDFYSPRGHVQQNDKSWPCLLDVTGSMQGISFVRHKRFTCIFLQGNVLPGSAWGNAICLQRRGLHLKRSGWSALHRGSGTASCMLRRSSHALVSPPGLGWPASAFWWETHKHALYSTETWRAFHCSVSSWESVIPFFFK